MTSPAIVWPAACPRKGSYPLERQMPRKVTGFLINRCSAFPQLLGKVALHAVPGEQCGSKAEHDEARFPAELGTAAYGCVFFFRARCLFTSA
jgi:hypothetical protein